MTDKEFEKAKDAELGEGIMSHGEYSTFHYAADWAKEYFEDYVNRELRDYVINFKLIEKQQATIAKLDAEIKRLHDKYDYQLLVKRDVEQQATIAILVSALEAYEYSDHPEKAIKALTKAKGASDGKG